MDIDIDIKPKTNIQELFETAIPASKVENKKLKQHNVGYHFQNVPVDKITGLSAIPFTKIDHFEYYKIDMISVNLLDYFNSKEEMIKLQYQEPDWNLLKNKKVVKQLFHLSKHFDTVSKVNPQSIKELADVLALIRPNKIRLLDKYLKNPEKIRPELFTKRDPKDIRKSHAVPYAILVVLQLHLIKQGRYKI